MLIRKVIYFAVALLFSFPAVAQEVDSKNKPMTKEGDITTTWREVGFNRMEATGHTDLDGVGRVYASVDTSYSGIQNGRGGAGAHDATLTKATGVSNANTVPNPCAGNVASGQPVILATGEKYKEQVDFSSRSLYPLDMIRTYHAFGEQVAQMFGKNWTSNYDYHLYAVGCDHDNTGDFPKTACLPHSLEFDTPAGSYIYTKTATVGVYKSSNADATGLLYYNGPGANYSMIIGSTDYTFNSSGNILYIEDATNASVMSFHYTNGFLTSVTNPGGQTISFTWNGSHVTQVTDPRGQIWSYVYNAAGMLQTVTSPDSHVTSYDYDPTHTSWLTGLTVDSVKILAVTYFSNGKVATSGTPDGERVDSFTYGTNTTTLTNQLGDAVTYTFQSVQGGLKLSGVSHAGTSTCPMIAASTAYDPNGWVDYTLDWKGIKTDYTYTPDGRLADRTLAAGTATPLKTVYTWTTAAYTGEYVVQSEASYDTTGALFRTTNYIYNGYGYVTSMSVKDQATGAIATVDYGYTFASNKTLQTATVTRNLPTGNAITTSNYDGFGNLTSVTDASGATVAYSGYDGLGRPATMVEANGITHSLTYDGRGNLASDVAILPGGNAITAYAYDGRNNLLSKTLPDGSSRQFTISQSGRVSARTDGAGNSATTTFANASTIITSQGLASATVSGGAIASSVTGSVTSTLKTDSLGRSYRVTGNNGQQIAYGYDANSNVTSVADALHTTTYSYDALDRMSLATLPDSSTITYGYSPKGTLGSVTTSRGAQTTYTTNGFGSVTQRVSPDTGTTVYTVDPFGRTTQELRANGTTVTYTYDGLDRLNSRTSGGNTEAYTYASSGINAGMLTAISNVTGSSNFGYDGRGHVSSETDTIYGQSFSSSYNYNIAGQLTSITYPDGLVVTYGYNGSGQATSVTASRTGGTVSSAVYQPFGRSPYAWAHGNGTSRLETIDPDGRITGLKSVFSKTISYNTDNTIHGVTDAAYPVLNETFSYDTQNRLTGTTRSGDPQSFTIDSDGNRTSQTRFGNSSAYAVSNGTNKVSSWTYMGGDLRSDGARLFSRDEEDRLSVVTINGQIVGQYRYDALDRRNYKNTTQGTTYFVYAPSGQLLYEQSGARTVNYVWFGGRLSSVSVNHGALLTIHTDWLGRPELITDSQRSSVVWQANNAVFDRSVILDNIGGMSLFFPGQYYDPESNLYYNWHRYYDAASGRYVQSDPIGLRGGINTYGYALGNPISYTDPLAFAVAGKLIGQNIGGWAAGLLGIETGPLDAALIMGGRYIGGALGSAIEDKIFSVWAADEGSKEWGRRTGVGAKEGKRRFHGIKQSCGGGATEDFGVDPESGAVYDPEGDIVGDLGDVKSK